MEFAHFGYYRYTRNKGPFIFCILSWKHAKNFLGQKMDDQLSHFKGGTAAAAMYNVHSTMVHACKIDKLLCINAL